MSNFIEFGSTGDVVFIGFGKGPVATDHSAVATFHDTGEWVELGLPEVDVMKAPSAPYVLRVANP